MDAHEIGQAFRIAAQYNGSTCRECRGNQTVGVVYMGALSASCENCGAFTLKGTITPEVLAAMGDPTPVRRR